jgi:hypothetical protein
MGAEAVIIAEIVVGVLQVFTKYLHAAGVKAEEIEKLLDESIAKVKATKPENLPPL